MEKNHTRKTNGDDGTDAGASGGQASSRAAYGTNNI
jgi:hypothetical protein